MRRFTYLLVSALVFLPLVSWGQFAQEELDRIYASTFEVVVKKITKDSLSYDRELPTDQIPFSVRNDQYWSIGTAFAIGPNRFISAAHVFNLHRQTQHKEFFLRNTSGKVFKLNKISRFSGDQDFIEFSLKGRIDNQFLEVNTKPKLNSVVYAVGNAHGEGIVVRDGLYTSNTPEEKAGAWNWIRFSAAASPGNSGGPLLDQQGRVLGIVLRKSSNENLNYALPIKQLLSARKNYAHHDLKMIYRLENTHRQKTGRFQYSAKLPMSFPKFNKKLSSALLTFTLDLEEEFVQQNAASTFPNGKGSTWLLHKTYNATFPHVISEQSDGSWLPSKPNKIRKSKLEGNGFLEYGRYASSILIRTRKPNNVSYEKFLSDGKLQMDYFLTSVNAKRRIGSERVRITSLGKPKKQFKHTDNYGRIWTIRKWLIEYDDSSVVTMTLPTPGGSISFMRNSSTGYAEDSISDLKILSNFIYISLYGTLKEWDEYFAHRDLPKNMQSIKLRYSPNESLKFSSEEVSFNYDHKLMKVTENSDMKLFFSYFKKKNKVRWDLSRVLVGENRNTSTFFEVVRNIKPEKDMGDKATDSWDRLVNKSFPYNNVSYFEDKNTYIGSVFSKKDSVQNIAKHPVVFSVFFGAEGKLEQDHVANKFQTFVDNLQIKASK